jgi:hypothetical protein
MPTTHPDLTTEQTEALARELDELRSRTVAELGGEPSSRRATATGRRMGGEGGIDAGESVRLCTKDSDSNVATTLTYRLTL